MSVPRFTELKDDYNRLWKSMQILPNRLNAVNAEVDRIVFNRQHYEAVAERTGVSWMIVGCIHALEASLSFYGHLHNGDSLNARTIHVPSGRPATGTPPFSWEQSAIDALLLHQTSEISGWSVEECLYFMERYNGWGYRLGAGRNTTPASRSPYLWSYTNLYEKGKYAADGQFSPELVSQQCGAAAILMQLFADLQLTPEVGRDKFEPLSRKLFQGVRGEDVANLQMKLRDAGFDPGMVDAQFGPRTKAAVMKFQEAAGIEIDGIVGSQTWKALHQPIPAVTPTTAAPSDIRQKVLQLAVAEASKARSQGPGNEIDQLVLDPLRPIMVKLGHLGASQTDTFYNWCAAWVTYVCRTASINIPDRYGDYWASVALVDSWRDMGRHTGAWFRKGDRTPKAGDIVTYNWDGDADLDHIGIVREYQPGNSTLVACEGNRDNREAVLNRNLASVDGFVDIDILAQKLGTA